MDIELFSEIYNCYFLVVRRILEAAADELLTEKEISALAAKYGYEETALAIVPKLIRKDLLSHCGSEEYKEASSHFQSAEVGEWDLLSAIDGGFRSKVKQPQPLPLTGLQKSWLRAVMADPRFRLFFSDQVCREIDAATVNTEPLFCWEDFRYFDRYGDGDPFDSAMYRRHFHALLGAIHDHRMLRIEYYSRKNHMISCRYIPRRIEYSSKDDKFRLLAIPVYRDGSRGDLFFLNIARILQIQDMDMADGDWLDSDEGEKDSSHILSAEDMEESLCPEPVLLEISNERNALERTMLHFACYRKQTERLGDSGKYLCKIYYREEMEMELLIQVLSFGPAVKVLGPEPFLKQIRERVHRQVQLLRQL